MTATRHASAGVRWQYFGPEPEGGDPLPAHAKAIFACRGAVAEAQQQSLRAVSEDETARQLVHLITAVDLMDAVPGSRPMRVVLMGRTMAGKSTLLSALTGGSAERIGIGAQQTTRDVFAAPALELEEVEVVDTPGVGAKDGAEDVALAMAEVPGADLVLWVASNDSFQMETAEALRAVASRGKPVVVALNCREPIVDDLGRDDFLEDPGSVFDQHEGHFETIRSHLAAVGVRPVAEVMLHAEAARQARTDCEYGPELREASRLDALAAVLGQESRERRPARRVLRDADEVRSQAEALCEAIAVVEQELRSLVNVGRGLREDEEQRTARLIDACMQRLSDDVVRLVGQRRGWHQTVTDFGPQVEEEWNLEQKALAVELDDVLAERVNELSRAIGEATLAAEREWMSAARPESSVKGLRDFRGLWKRKAAGIAIGGGGAVAFAIAGAKLGVLAGTAVGGPPGAVVGLAVGAISGGVGSILVTTTRRTVQSLFTSRTKILEANRDLLRSGTDKALTEIEAQAQAAASETIVRARDAVAAASEQHATAEAGTLGVADCLASQRWKIRLAIAALDSQTTRCLLHLDGRPRLAASVTKATRLPGVCVAVEVTDERFTEALLFPPSSPETLAFGRAPTSGPPGARVASYVLGLTEVVPRFIRCRTDDTVVAVGDPSPRQVLAAWSATLSDHLDTPVEIVRSSATRSVPA